MRRTIIFLLSLTASVLLALYLDGLFLTGNLALEIVDSSIAETLTKRDPKWPSAIESKQVDDTSLDPEKVMPSAESELDNRSNENHNANYRCQVKAEKIAYKKVGQIYKWTDSTGNTRFSDKEPSDDNAVVINAGKDVKQFFDVNVTYPTGSIPTNITAGIKKKTKGIYRIYEQLLPIELLSKSKIDIFIYANEQAYEAEKHKIAPTLAAADGFYTHKGNKAYVIYKGNSGRTERVAIHESAHVVHAHNFGRTPKWFNEGMAEALEYISVSGYSMTLHLNKDWVSRLGTTIPILPLEKLLSSTDKDWAGDDRNVYYANAWAFSYFMMQHNNRFYMQDFLNLMIADKCSEPNSLKFFEGNYPGGLNNLERTWAKWVLSKNKVPLTF